MPNLGRLTRSRWAVKRKGPRPGMGSFSSFPSVPPAPSGDGDGPAQVNPNLGKNQVGYGGYGRLTRLSNAPERTKRRTRQQAKVAAPILPDSGGHSTPSPNPPASPDLRASYASARERRELLPQQDTLPYTPSFVRAGHLSPPTKCQKQWRRDLLEGS